MLGTTVLIPAYLVPQMGGGNVIFFGKYDNNFMNSPWYLFCKDFLFKQLTLRLSNQARNFWSSQEEKAKVIQTLIFVAGLNTLMQTLFETCLPTVIGGSYTFVPATLSIVLAGRYNDITSLMINPVHFHYYVFIILFDPFHVILM